MKIFYAQINDGSSMKKRADKFEVVDNMIYVWHNGHLVALIDMGVVLYAHIYDPKGVEM